MWFSGLELFVMFVAAVVGICTCIPPDPPAPAKGNGTYGTAQSEPRSACVI